MTQPPARKFPGIFISYRRDDSSGHAGRLYDHLVRHFGKDQVFMDIDLIEPGDDFVQIIEDAVSSCDVLLPVIGRGWLSAAATGGARRLDNPNDFVRLEIAAALQRDILVIPVLVQETPMPARSELPEDLSGLSRRQALEVSDRRWDSDVKRLIAAIERVRARRQEEVRREQEREAEERRRQKREDEERRSKEQEAEEQRRREKEARRREQEEARRLREQAERVKRLQEEAVKDELGAVEEKAWRVKEAEERASPAPSLQTPPLWSSTPPNRLRAAASSITGPMTQVPSRVAADTAQRRPGGRLFPILIGGGLTGVLSTIPLLNALCVIWAVGGGMLAVNRYRKRADVPVTAGEGAKLGAWAGLIGWLLSAAVGGTINYYNFTSSSGAYAPSEEGAITAVLMLYTLVAALVIPFSTIGGLIEVKRKE